MTAPVTIAIIQMRMSSSVKRNVAKAVTMVRSAAHEGARVICLPELYRTRYFPRKQGADAQRLAETIPGESTEMFSCLARELEAVLIVPVFENAGGRLFNTACVIDADGTMLGTYRKVHIPNDPSFYEASYFESGDRGYPVFTSRYLRLAALICYDQWVPEAARIAALEGADVIFYPSAIGHLRGDPLPASDWRSAWETVQRSHAIANAVHVAAVNRVGQEGELAFWGGSFVCDAFGRMLAQAPLDQEHVLLATIDVDQNREIEQGWGFRRNRRPETYARISAPAVEPTPRDLGFSMPAEWETHSSTWLAWPYDRETFDDLPAVEETFLRLIDALHRGEHIDLAVKDHDMKRRVARLLRDRGIDPARVILHVLDYADVWFRDYGPIFVVNRSRTARAMVHWRFNAWGGKYESLLRDQGVPSQMRALRSLGYFSSDMVLEGGAIDANGLGTLLTTEQCLLHPSRNPELTKAGIEESLRSYLGAERVIWLMGGIAGDDTDGHVDTVARFVSPRTVAYAYAEDPEDANYDLLAENHRRLCDTRDQDGNRLQLIRLPLPHAIVCDVRGEHASLPASYLNFYIGNDAVAVPVFRDQNDACALDTLRSAFPDRTVVGIDCVDLLHGLGALHCITQQEPLAGQ